ncbi:hypothetical protein [Sporosarcina sp. P3]|uniref:hypothetical protein n=1 Tax=Sporosarcina sp. P3 TaxID=2048245 RepID=UPI0018EB7345|nr:hypothetical protein [Sporosarcina sp. P3]
MKILAILLIIIGAIGLLLSTMMFGDIGIAAAVGSVGALLSGIGFILVDKKLKILINN